MNQNSYQTRRLLATRALRHDGQNVETDGEVFATETDARYLIRTGVARDPGAPAPPSIAPQATTTAPRRGPGRPSRAESAARAPASSALMTSDARAPSGAGAAADMDAQNSSAGTGDAGAGEAGGATDAGESGERAGA
jgi:hypothetical protein